MIEHARYTYTITNGTHTLIGYLYTDNVLYWERKGYTVKRTS